MTLLSRWVRLWSRQESAESLALVRIFVGMVILYDLAEVARFGLVRVLWAPIEEGGLGPASYAQPTVLFYELFGASVVSAWALFAIAVTAALCLSSGLFAGASALLLLFAYAQIEKLSPDGDRGIDTLLRNALLILVFARSDRTWSLWSRIRYGSFASGRELPAWPRYLLCAQLTLLYCFAGFLKQSSNWSHQSGYAALSMVLHKPHLVRTELPHEWLMALYPLTQIGTFATIVWERSAIFLPILLWLRGTAARGGSVRGFINRARLLELWVAIGVSFHLALAALLALGIFPWGCLALYPALATGGRFSFIRVWRRKTTAQSARPAVDAAPARRALPPALSGEEGAMLDEVS